MDDDNTMHGKIIGIDGVGGSVLILRITVSGRIRTVYAEARLTIEALADAFGSIEDALAQEIEFETDDLGTLTSFRPH